MGTLFGNRSGRVNQPNMPSYYAARVQTSVQGNARPLGWGQTRMAGNLLLLANFEPRLVPQLGQPAASRGGKGGIGGGGGGGKGGGSGVTFTWNYGATVIIGFGDSEVSSILTVYAGSSVSAFSGATTFSGSYSQNPWSYTLGETSFQKAFAPASPTQQQIAYRGEAYAAFGYMDFGGSNSVPNYSYEVLFTTSYDIPSLGPDANPVHVFYEYLTSPSHGVPGFSSSLVGDWTDFTTYCRAFSLLISTVEANPRAASSFLTDVARTLNVDFVWSSGQLRIVPYTPFGWSGNGYSWQPPTTPEYDITDKDFIIDPSSSDSSSVRVKRKPRSQMVNHLRLEYAARSNYYNPEVASYVDEGAIATYGMERIGDLVQAHHFALDAAANNSVMLMATRTAIAATYEFTVGRKFIRLDPMDVVTLTESNIGLDREPVRILEIKENSDGTLLMTAEEYPVVAGPPAYGKIAYAQLMVDYNIDPGIVNDPIFFEPPDTLAGGLYLYCGVSGKNLAVWGGCDVYVSYDGLNYGKAGRISGPSRMGVLTSSLPAVQKNYYDQTIDSTNVLAVDLSESGGALSSGSDDDMTGLNLLCCVGNELVSYQTATLTGTNKYSLSPLVRGAYDVKGSSVTSIASHSAGATFLRLDNAVFSIPFTQDRIGSTLYVKFLSFNVFGGGEQALSDVGAFTYKLTGAALASPLPNVTNLRAFFEAGFMKMYWDEVSDFRTGIRYQIFKGPSFNAAMQIGDQAHPPFTIFGDDNYFVRAFCTPVSGLTVTSASPVSLAVAGNQLTENIVVTRNEQTENWPGTRTNLTVNGIPGAETLVLNAGQAEGAYEIPTADWIDVGYQAKASVNAIWSSTGSPVGDNILSISNVLEQTDVLGSFAASYVSSWIEIAVAPDAGIDVFANADVFVPPDVFSYAISWSDWQKFVPGTYAGRFFKFRLVVQNSNPAQVTATVLAMRVDVSVPARIDHYQNTTVAAAGTLISFVPDGQSEPRKFNGGPNSNALPYVNASWQNQPGDQLLLTGLTTSEVTVKILNGGVGVERTGVNLNVEGY